MAKFVLYVGTADLDKAIKGIHTRGQALQKEMHKVAVSVLSHVAEHGDVRMVAKIVQAMPSVARINALKAWFEAFGPITFDGDDVKFRKGVEADLTAAKANPFYDYTKEEVYKPIVPVKALAALIKKFETDEEKTSTDHSTIIAGLKAQLTALQGATAH